MFAKFCTLVCYLILLAGCTHNSQVNIKPVVKDYFTVYAQRQDFDKLLSFYDEKAQLEDLVYGHHAKSKTDIEQFFAWNDGKFALVKPGPALVIQKQVFEGNKVATEGYFTEFTYDGQQMGPWRFLIWLEFNSSGKIIRHVDWINYTPKENFIGGQNLNSINSSAN